MAGPGFSSHFQGAMGIAMNLWLRLLLVLLRARWGASLGPLDTSRVPFRVWPHDCDVNWHMNNGRYATLMDLGRVDLMVRAGFLRAIRREKLYPVVAAQHLTYRHGLDPFQAFTLETRVLGWDERFIVLEQRFVRGERVHARGYVQALFADKDGRVPTARVVTLLGIESARNVPEPVAVLFPPSARLP